MSRSRGRSQTSVKEQQRRQFENQQHTQNIQQASQENTKPSPDKYLEELGDTDLQEGSRRILENWTAKDFPFANYRSEDIERLRYELKVTKMKFRDMHPTKQCLVTGDLRAFANDDPTDTLEPLRPQDKAIADSFIEGVFSRMTRGKEGFQQKEANKSYSESVVRRSEEERDGGMLGGGGLLGGGR